MRLFTGFTIAPEVTERLAHLLEPLRSEVRAQWSPPENLHITTKFLGEWPESRLEAVEAALDALPKPAPFIIEIERLGFFPNAHSPRVLWAGVRAPQALAELARATDLALSAIGVEPEKRSYSPHLTLARIKPDSPLARLKSTVAEQASAAFGSTPASEFHLYLSCPAPGGSRYNKLSTFLLPPRV